MYGADCRDITDTDIQNEECKIWSSHTASHPRRPEYFSYLLLLLVLLYLLTAIVLSPGDSGYLTCTQI
jgi:hypothetical protein